MDDGSLWDDNVSWGELANPKTIFIVVNDDDGVNNYYFDSITSSGRSALFAASSTTNLILYAGNLLKSARDFATSNEEENLD